MNIESKKSIPASAKSALIIACFFWAASFIASKIALENVPPLTVVFFRLLISTFCFLLWWYFRGNRIPKNIIKKNKGKILLLSLFGTGLHYSIQTIGISYTTPSNASLYAATGPITITILAVFFLNERLTFKKIIGIGMAFIGVILVLGVDKVIHLSFGKHIIGDILVLISIFMWGIFTVLGKNLIKHISPIDLTALITTIGTVYMAPAALGEILIRNFSLAHIPISTWLSIVFLGITCSFLATFLYVFALNTAESQKVGVYLYTIPPMSYIIAFLVLKDFISLNLIIGTVVVLLGVYITEKG